MAKESDRDLNPQQGQRNGQSAISQDNPLRELHQEGNAQSDRPIGSALVSPELTDQEVSVLCDVERDGSTKSDKEPVVKNGASSECTQEKVENGGNSSNWMIIRNGLIKTKRIEKLTLVVIEPPHHRSPPSRIASEQQNHRSQISPTTFATKSAITGSRASQLLGPCDARLASGERQLNLQAPRKFE
jgi:hypothetical protein